ncbi:hypothetical protein [Salinibacter ruber]|jgi:hypothetical protein|uniref:hypothetical protein n=1 Tax=Salinibacter ruber TaxID=146919 RepID=UPI0021677D63|nr:hypothetical protein [Salinibacter ruber]
MSTGFSKSFSAWGFWQKTGSNRKQSLMQVVFRKTYAEAQQVNLQWSRSFSGVCVTGLAKGQKIFLARKEVA